MRMLRNFPRLRKTYGWFVVNWRWLTRGRVAYVAVLVPFAACLYAMACTFPGSHEARVRIAGTVLQLLGIWTVVRGLNETRRLFGLPGIAAEMSKWWKSWPWRGPAIITGSGVLRAGPSTVSGRFTISKPEVASRSVEQRLEHLERETRRLSNDLQEIGEKFDASQAELRTQIASETRALLDKHSKLARLLTRAHTGGIDVSLAGLVWLAVGVVMASVPSEVTYLLGFVARAMGMR